MTAPGSLGSAHAERGRIDEYRLLTFPTAVGSGRRLFPVPTELRLVSSGQVGPATLSVLEPVA